MYKPFKSAAVGLFALLAVSASAQIGGSGWTPQTLDFKVQWPYNVAEDTRYSFTNGVYHMLTYSTDVAFEKGNTTRPRTEQRFNPDFTGGDIQYQAMLMVPADENSYCIMQDHTGDAQSPAFGPVAIMFIWQSKDGGSIWNGYTGHELANNLGGLWFQLNVDHNVATHTIKAWINQQLVVSEADNGATDYYFKDGVYEQDISTPTLQMDTYVKDIQMWASSGTGGPSTVADPVFNPGGGTYTTAQNVSITSATGSVSIRYTTDGSMPSETAGAIYSGPVNISSNATINAIAYKAGFIDSNVTSAAYTINPPPQAAAPVFSPGAGTYTSVQNVAISSATGGVTIHYTTDGSMPSETNGTVYSSSAVRIGTTTTLQAIAFETGYTDSSVTSGSYTISLPQAADPVFTPGGGTYTHAQTVSITSATSGVSIRYTTDGSNPSETTGTLYSGAVSISSNTTLNAIAFKAGFIDSAVTSAAYTIIPPPTFNFEAATMSPVGTGATVSTSSDPNVTGGLLEFLNSTAVGQSITLTTPSMPAGTYKVQFRYKTNTSRAQHNVKIDGTQVGGTIDQYATTSTYPTATLGNVIFAATGTHKVVLTVTGKDTAATHFYISADKFTFVGQ